MAVASTERATMAGVLSPSLTLAAALAAFRDVRLRRGEYGILRAIGVRLGRVLGMFVAKAAVLGLAGAAAYAHNVLEIRSGALVQSLENV